MNRNELIGHVNANWWTAINEYFDISVHSKKTHRIQLHLTEQSVSIIVPRESCQPETFTFEMGKLYLLCKQWHITDYLTIRFEKEPLLRWVLNESLFYWIGTQLEALLLLPLMQQAGYDISRLRREFQLPSPIEPCWQQLTNGFTASPITSHTISLYIHQFFLIKVGVLLQAEVDHLIRKLESICMSLYTVLDHLIIEWTTLTTEDKLTIPYAYKIVLKDFVHALGNWCTYHYHIQPQGSN